MKPEQASEHLQELTTHCIRCGFCLESCPTFVETGNELSSPRGRIYLVRSATEGKLKWEDIRPSLDSCLGCRACETACPSGVQYGQILEFARERISKDHPDKAKEALLGSTTSPSMLRTQLGLGRLLPGKRIPAALSKLLSGEVSEVDRPVPQSEVRLPDLDSSSLPAVKGEVYLLEGCAMRVLFPRVHQATRRLLRRAGYTVHEVNQGCCGSMHAHSGYLDAARQMAEALIHAMPGDLPIVVNSAGCGSTIKEYGHLLPNSEAATAFGARVVDASEFLHRNGFVTELRKSNGLSTKVTYHDACHLSHGQRITAQPRELLAAIPGIELVPLAESDMCCGSAGIYNVLQPKMARSLLERKYANIAATEAAIVATGNPGCHAWIAQAAREHGRKVSVLHTMELLEAAFTGIAPFED